MPDTFESSNKISNSVKVGNLLNSVLVPGSKGGLYSAECVN